MTEERPESVTNINGVDLPTPIFNVVLQKVIQVDKPARYYKNKNKTKIFIY